MSTPEIRLCFTCLRYKPTRGHKAPGIARHTQKPGCSPGFRAICLQYKNSLWALCDDCRRSPKTPVAIADYLNMMLRLAGEAN